MDTLRQRGSSGDKQFARDTAALEDQNEPLLPMRESNMSTSNQQETQNCTSGRLTANSGLQAWAYLPSFAIVTTLLLCSLYVLRTESVLIVNQEGTIAELKTQIRHLRHEVLEAKSSGQCGGSAISQLQEDLHKYRWEAEKLMASKHETDTKMQDLTNKVTMLQSERNRMKAALKVLKQELGGEQPKAATEAVKAQ